jgi:hypothetical protein
MSYPTLEAARDARTRLLERCGPIFAVGISGGKDDDYVLKVCLQSEAVRHKVPAEFDGFPLVCEFIGEVRPQVG